MGLGENALDAFANAVRLVSCGNDDGDMRQVGGRCEWLNNQSIAVNPVDGDMLVQPYTDHSGLQHEAKRQ